MSLSATLFGRDSLIFKATNILGLGIPGLLDKQFGPGETPGQALGEIAQQTAKEAEPRVTVWGRVRPIGGNIIHCQTPVRRWVKQKSSGGKGGGGKTQKVENIYRTYAIGVCEGPITGFSRIWRNGKLVYDARSNEWGENNNPVFLKKFRLYLGGWSQMPSPELEAIWGAGQVPAYRGTAYMVAINENLTELGGSVPQWMFEVERAEFIASTSKPYGLLSRDELRSAHSTPNNLSVRTVVHRVELSDVLACGLSTQNDVIVRSSTQYLVGSETIAGGIPTPGSFEIETSVADSSVSEWLMSARPTPNDMDVKTARISLQYRENLTCGTSTPNNMTVTT